MMSCCYYCSGPGFRGLSCERDNPCGGRGRRSRPKKKPNRTTSAPQTLNFHVLNRIPKPYETLIPSVIPDPSHLGIFTGSRSHKKP
ncbi:hypothetical protein CY35_01G149000 [Sphagnum magellanicum]|nr:hypothetical protein CY35_01G149000 [Sphagnum magellanicum]